jgi:NTE family protein
MHGLAKPVRRWRNLFSARTIEQAFRTAIGQGLKEDARGDLKTPNIFRVCAQSVVIMENVINELHLRQNPYDLLIRPSLNGITLLEFYRAKEVIAAGETSAMAALPEIEYLLQNA